MKRHSLNANYMTSRELESYGIYNADQRNILIHSTAVIVNFDAIDFGSNIRIDPFVVLSCSDLRIGNHVHIATGCAIFGTENVSLGDYSNLSAKVLVYSTSDDYSGQAMTNPTVPKQFTNVENSPVEIGRHCILGARTTILPGAHLGEGAATGSGTLVKGTLPPWTVSVGNPAKQIKLRSKECLEKEKQMHISNIKKDRK